MGIVRVAERAREPASGSALAAHAPGMDWRSQPTDSDLLAALERQGPMDCERALAVMARHGLDGLVLGEPVNVHHALGHWPQIGRTRAGQPPGTFALIARARIHEDPDPVQDSWWNNMLTRARIPAGPPPAQPRKPADRGTPTS